MSVAYKKNGTEIPITSAIMGGKSAGEIYDTTNEVVIGTYDGKPLYRKLVTFTISGNHTAETGIAHNIPNFKEAIRWFATCNGIPTIFTSGTWFWNIVRISSSNIGYVNNGISGVTKVWIDYTKTTD